MTAQDYVDAEIEHHEAGLAAKLREGSVQALTTHVRAILHLRQVAASQYRPRLFVPAHLQPPAWHEDALRAFTTAINGVESILENESTPEVMTITREPIVIEDRTPAEEAYRHRLQAQRAIPFVDPGAPDTSPIYAQVRDRHGFGVPSRR